jgi:TorA maturation chaperone TorD/predicted transcriptional regulator
VPALAGHLPSPFDADEAAADHQHLFGFNVFAHEAIFRAEDGLLGGLAGEAVVASYRQAGYTPEIAASSADHLGHELGLLAFLCGAEADAWQDGVPAAVRRTRILQRDFLHTHLLPWLPPLALALGRQSNAFYAAVAKLTLALAADHATALGGLPVGWALPALPPRDEAQTGLREIARLLLAPVSSGLYLSRDDIGALAQALQLPRGFGGREQMLVNLLRAAAQYEVLDDLLRRLEQVVEAWRRDYRTMVEPALAPYAAAWEQRAAATAGFLREMGAQAGRDGG